MYIDMHIHTRYSNDSHMELEDAIVYAKDIGLDGLCVTDHESMDAQAEAATLAQKHDFLVLVGMEVLTRQGDLLIFGLEEVPRPLMDAGALVREVTWRGGIAISAHPFRNNERGLGNHINQLSQLSGIEVLNGSTLAHHNLQALHLSRKLGLPGLGGSDAHQVDRIGRYVSVFPGRIRDLQDLIQAIKAHQVQPLAFKEGMGSLSPGVFQEPAVWTPFTCPAPGSMG